MKIQLSLTLLFAAFIFGATDHYDYSSLRITPEYSRYTLGELISVQSKMELNPRGYLKYQNPPEASFGWWCKDGTDKYEMIHFIPTHTVLEPVQSLKKLPISYNYGFGLPAFKIGTLTCRIQGKYLLAGKDGGRTIFTIISNAITIDVRPLNPEDEIILKSLGIYENYMNGPPTMKTVHGAFDYSKHQNSQYYCHFMASKLREIYKVTPIERVWESYSDIKIIWNAHNHYQGFLERSRWIDTLVKNRCDEISPAEIAYWRANNALLLGEFDDAILLAKLGLSLNPNPAHRAFFERLLKTPTLGEYLHQFKSVTDQQGYPVKF